MRENDVLQSICEYLAFKRYFFWRQNTNPIFSDGHFRKMPKWSKNGVPDVILVKDGIFYGIEVKAPQRGKQSANQIDFEAGLTANGGKYILATSIDDVSPFL